MPVRRRQVRAFLTVLLTSVLWSACTDQMGGPAAPDSGELPLTAAVSVQELLPVMDVQMRHTPALMRTIGVLGTAVGLDDRGRPSVQVLAMPGHADVPSRLEGIPVQVIETGPIFALQQVDGDALAKPCASPPCNKGGGDVDLTSRLRPAPLGASIGHTAITAGTLGARVTRGASYFALSNNHVFADENQASNGDAIIQPGNFDGGSSPADDIGALSDYEPINFGACTNVMDAAIASVSPADVSNSTPDGLGYGTPRSSTIAPAVNMRVQKVGRTTGHSKAQIQAINATVNVGYDTGVACFTGQIITGNMSAGGDSGSLTVVDGKGKNKNDDKKPVGLVFAGSSTVTIHSPIDAILTRFNVSIDGN